MDYISKKIGEKSELNVFTGNFRDAATQEQSRIEYILVLTLGYLWNKNISRVDDDSRTMCFQSVVRPSIGSILNLVRVLDIEGEIFGGGNLEYLRMVLINTLT